MRAGKAGAMPYRWERRDSETLVLRVSPFQSLTPRGYVVFVGVTAGLLLMPLLAVLGSPAMWGLLPFLLAALAAVMLALTRSNRSRSMCEVLVLRADRASLLRSDPGRPDRHWQANPYWIRVTLRADGPVEDYLTLSGGTDPENSREVELGAFLSPEERVSLARELREVLGQIRHPRGPASD